MSHNVRTNLALIQLPKGSGTDTQRIEISGTTVLLTNDEYNRLPSSAFTSGDLTDLGVVADVGGSPVTVQAAFVTAPAALTAPADLGATYTQANVNALRTDVAALRTTLNAVLTALQAAGGPMKAS